MQRNILLLLLSSFLMSLTASAQISPPDNVTASPNYVCPGSTTSLSATLLDANNSILWYTVPSAGTPIGTTASGASLVVTPSGNTTYYAETTTPSGSKTINYTKNDTIQWRVPPGVTQVTVDAKGASGRTVGTKTGGKGGRVQATINLPAGTTMLIIRIGGHGGASGGEIGYNGGGASGTYRGGGATDIQIGNTRILVAGGGGAASTVANGGNAGNPASAGANGIGTNGGGGATASAVGAGGTHSLGGLGIVGNAGTITGIGGIGVALTNSGTASGNGGGGYFGGGSGAAHATTSGRSAGGGGGSSFVSPSVLEGTAIYDTATTMGSGSITISWAGQKSTRVPVTVNITQAPTNIAVSNIAANSADVSWTAATSVNDYTWKLVAAGAGVNATAVQQGATSNQSINLTGLSTATAYDIYVRSQCASGIYSNWSAATSFTTTISYPPTASFGNLLTPCNNFDKPTLTLAYSNLQNSPDVYSITSNIPDFSDVIDESLAGGEINIDLSGTTPAAKTLYTLYITLKNTTTGATSTAYTKNITFYDIPSTVPVYTNPGQVYANIECIDALGWSHYIDTTSNTLVLSMLKNNWNPGTLVTSASPASGEYSVNVGFAGTSGYVHVKDNTATTGAAPYVQIPGGWYIMDKSFDVKTLVQPSSPVAVRYYYETAQYNALNTIVDALGDPIPSEDSLIVYKLKTGESYSHLQNAHAGLQEIDLDFYANSTRTAFLNTFDVFALTSSVHYFEYAVGHFSGGGGGGASGGAAPLIPSIFSVELVNFKGYATPTANELVWQTASEINNDKFEVEGSLNGKDFALLGTVKSLAQNGNSNKVLSYSFRDNGMQNSYYRLKQIDINGATTYSNIIEIAPNQTSMLYPNPASDNLNLIYTKANQFSVQILNITGQNLMSLPLSSENYRQIDVRELPQGVYMLKIIDEKNRVVENLKWTK